MLYQKQWLRSRHSAVLLHEGWRRTDTHHVTRLCGGSHVREDGTIAATAFKLKPGESYLSVNWLEFLALPNRALELAEVRRVLASKRKIGRASRLAVMNVG